MSTGDGAQPLRLTSTLLAGVLYEAEVVALEEVDELKLVDLQQGRIVERFSEPPLTIGAVPASQGRLVCQAAQKPVVSSQTPARCDVVSVASAEGLGAQYLSARGVLRIIPSYTTAGECVLQLAYPAAMRGAGVTREVRLLLTEL